MSDTKVHFSGPVFYKSSDGSTTERLGGWPVCRCAYLIRRPMLMSEEEKDVTCKRCLKLIDLDRKTREEE